MQTPYTVNVKLVDARPVTREELEAVTRKSIRLSALRRLLVEESQRLQGESERLKQAWENLVALEEEAVEAKRNLLARLANGAELEPHQRRGRPHGGARQPDNENEAGS